MLDQLELYLPLFGEGVSKDSSFVSDFSVVVAVVMMVAVSVSNDPTVLSAEQFFPIPSSQPSPLDPHQAYFFLRTR